VSRHGSVDSTAGDFAASSRILSLNVNGRIVPPFAPINGEPVRRLAVSPLPDFAVAVGASKNIAIPQAFLAGTAFSFPRAVLAKKEAHFPGRCHLPIGRHKHSHEKMDAL
jgi:hypothetical protein